MEIFSSVDRSPAKRDNSLCSKVKGGKYISIFASPNRGFAKSSSSLAQKWFHTLLP